MITAACMRWSPGAVQSWRRPEDGGFNPARYAVAELPDAEARAFVLNRHYSASYPAARLRYGLADLKAGTLAGVAVLSVPASRRCCPCALIEVSALPVTPAVLLSAAVPGDIAT